VKLVVGTVNWNFFTTVFANSKETTSRFVDSVFDKYNE